MQDLQVRAECRSEGDGVRGRDRDRGTGAEVHVGRRRAFADRRRDERHVELRGVGPDERVEALEELHADVDRRVVDGDGFRVSAKATLFLETSTGFPRFRNCTAGYVPAEPPPRTHTSRTIRRASDAHALRPVSFAAAAAAAELVATLRTSRRRTVMLAILSLGVDEAAARGRFAGRKALVEGGAALALLG